MGTVSSCAPARTDCVAPAGVEDLERHEEPERAGRRAHETRAVAGDGVDRHARQIGEVREERAERHVLTEGHPVHLLEHADDVAAGSPGDDLVAERGGRRRLGHPGEERGVELAGQPLQQRRLRRARQRPVERDDVLGPHDQLRGRVGRCVTRRVAASWAANTDAGGTSCLLRPRCPPPWTSATRSVRTGAPPSGATVPTTASDDDARRNAAAPMTRRARDGGGGVPAGPRPAWRGRPRRPRRRR